MTIKQKTTCKDQGIDYVHACILDGRYLSGEIYRFIAGLMADFLEACRNAPREWQRIFNGGPARVTPHDTWKQYAERMMTLSRIFGFRKYISSLERQDNRPLHPHFLPAAVPAPGRGGSAEGGGTAGGDNFVFQ